MITETTHQGNLILISQEKCAEMECLDAELYPIKCLELSGLFERELLKNWGLKDEDSWLDLINLYEGNPFYLNDIALLIKDIFDGNVAEFLAENCSTGSLSVRIPVITSNMRSHFNQLWKRVAEIEQQLILELSKFEQGISREELRDNLELSSLDLISGLQSLQHRYLVKKIREEKTLFKLELVLREYVRNCCQE